MANEEQKRQIIELLSESVERMTEEQVEKLLAFGEGVALVAAQQQRT